MQPLQTTKREISEYTKNNTINVRLIPNSSKNEIVSWDNEKSQLKIKIKAPPENNKANLELIKFLRKEYNLKVSIIKGKKSRDKTVHIDK